MNALSPPPSYTAMQWPLEPVYHIQVVKNLMFDLAKEIVPRVIRKQLI